MEGLEVVRLEFKLAQTHKGLMVVGKGLVKLGKREARLLIDITTSA